MSTISRVRQSPRAESSGAGKRLGRGNPLVPADTAASRALVAVIAVLTFLAALAAGVAAIVADSAEEWRAAIGREATIQLRPAPNRDTDADIARAAEIARGTPGVVEARAFSKAESEDLLQPWLGRGLDLTDLPVPRIVVLKLDRAVKPDLEALRSRLAERVPGALVDDHGGWIVRLTTMANTIVVIAFGLVVLVLAAAGAAVAFATRGAMAANREVVDVLHVVGAADRFIAREFQARFVQFGLKGGLLGAAGTCLFIAGCGVLSSWILGGASALEAEALFGSFRLGWRGYGLIAGIAILVAALAGLVSGHTVRRYLSES